MASVIVSLLAAEGLLRMSGRVRIPPTTIAPARPDLYQEYKPYGYRLWPSRTVTYLYPRQNPRLLTIRSNGDGFRGARELGSLDSRPRVIVLGDSMVFGDGVEEEERFTERLEADEPHWRVDNLGMTGYGPDLMLRSLEQVGVPLKPKVVILTFYTDDFRRVRPENAGVGFEIPRFQLRSGRLVDMAYPHPGFWTTWRTIAAVREVVWRVSRAEWKLNAAILDRYREDAARTPFTFVILFLPGIADTPNDDERRMWLRAYAQRTGTAFLDLTDAIHDPQAPPPFIPNNAHLNPQGHIIVAREIRRLLRPIMDAS
jgi:hypothetical protein